MKERKKLNFNGHDEKYEELSQIILLSYYKVGSQSKVRIYNPQEKKLNPWTINGYFIVYFKNTKGYRFYCPSHHTRIVESRNEKFLENDLFSGSHQFQNIAFEKNYHDG
ncbi:hypothetical protein CR513_37950, partial [Mucuna pruriens]